MDDKGEDEIQRKEGLREGCKGEREGETQRDRPTAKEKNNAKTIERGDE